ncbi:CHRD domain-containing protein [Pseudoalteromonas 'SMAR']|uniref:CHRD domain-containing protein n=1 Tax=Pseudoalteromonas 'SMAR' TaxID=3416908 RepID=UPI003AF2FE4E
MKKYIVSASLMLLVACSDSDDDVTVTPPTPTPPPAPEFSATKTFELTLSGKQEVPMNDSMQTATASVELDENLMQFRATLDYDGVEGFSAAHIHDGDLGENGEVAFAFEAASENQVSIPETELSEALMADMLDGDWYINLHTESFPNGELRAQIVPDTTSIITFKLNAAQQVPMNQSSAMGDGYAAYDSTNGELYLRAVTSGVDDASAAHIHTGRIGANGDVLVVLEQDDQVMSDWVTPEGTMIDEETLNVLLSGGHYVNVHSPEFPDGEIRGQIVTDNYAIATFKLSGQQEVPAVSTMGSGDGYALVNTSNYGVELRVVTSGVEDATAAHIHTGRIGMNGDVLVGLEQSSDDMNVWMSPENLTIDAETFAVLASGGHYVNVHTPAHTGGELRGQILTDNYTLVAFPLSGEQEVPAVTTTAMGSGYALVNRNDFALELQVLTSGVEDATMAHIHTGFAGENGPVLIGLEQSQSDVNRWMAPADAALTAEIFALLASGGHYVNVHTPANPSGELRGQIQ